MNTIGVVLLAAATATSGIGKPHSWKVWLRPHAVSHGAPPASGPVAPGMGMAPGAGADMGFGGAGNRRFPNTRSQVFFVDPPGMQIGWQTGGGQGMDRVYLPAQLVVPARYNFTQGYIYRLKVNNIPGRPGLTLYPTIEVAPSTPATDAFLTHNPIPAQFTEEDFDQVTAGNFVTKVIYLPDPKYQELAIAGVETLVSTRLEPGVDPVLEADRRGTILMIVRLGGIDLEVPSTIGGVGAPIYGDPASATLDGPAMAPFDPSGVPPLQPVDTGNVTEAPVAPLMPDANLPTEAPIAPEPGNFDDAMPAPPTPDLGNGFDAPLPPEVPQPNLDLPVAPPGY